ncbi:uncharacterized protein LOC130590932 [Beta vulgaris subsp. vulgaris]|nr:uncharacterized protein LOC130590932 [Beta vulgaris subsp. vulgaris]
MLQTRRGRPSLVGYAMVLILRGIVLLTTRRRQRTHNLVLFKTKVDDSWWIDSGASRHVCNNKDFFKSLKDLDDGPILYMGNDSTVKARGIGQVELLLTSGKTLTLRDVVYVPEVRKNLV